MISQCETPRITTEIVTYAETTKCNLPTAKRGSRMGASTSDKVFAALETFRIEFPSWGFANTGTRFGKFIQPAAATTTEEKFSDAGQVHLLHGRLSAMASRVVGLS